MKEVYVVTIGVMNPYTAFNRVFSKLEEAIKYQRIMRDGVISNHVVHDVFEEPLKEKVE